MEEGAGTITSTLCNVDNSDFINIKNAEARDLIKQLVEKYSKDFQQLVQGMQIKLNKEIAEIEEKRK